MAAITPEEALAYFRRWELVREAEARELRRTPMETKLQQLASLMASRHVFGPEPDREAQLQLVRERWARLRRGRGGGVAPRGPFRRARGEFVGGRGSATAFPWHWGGGGGGSGRVRGRPR